MDTRKFILKAEHLKLLRHANWQWENCEFGAPGIDCKRPYGNSSVIRDMIKILDIKDAFSDPDDDEVREEIESSLRNLHAELEDALAIIFQTQSFELGEYVGTQYRDGWRKV